MYEDGYSTRALRVKAVEAVVKDGQSVATVAEIFGFDRASVYRWIERFWEDESMDRRKGSGRPRLLTDEQLGRLLKLILKPATKYGFETDFWTSSRIVEVAGKQLAVKISGRTMRRLLRESDFSYKKPERRYYEADEKAKDEWVNITMPLIKKTVKKHRAILYFEDEATVRLTAVLGKSWGPRSEKIVQRVTGNRGSIAAMSAIDPAGRLLFTLHDKRIASDEVINFLAQMLKHHPKRHLVVVMDQAPPHTSKKTRVFAKEQKRLHVFYLPPRSPELNPDEQVWNHLKNHELKSHTAKNKDELRVLAQRKLRKMSMNQSQVRGLFFRSYVADFLA